jgi:hypothetical protein
MPTRFGKRRTGKGHDVSLNSLSGLITKLTTSPTSHVRSSLGVSKS